MSLLLQVPGLAVFSVIATLNAVPDQSGPAVSSQLRGATGGLRR